MTIACLLANTLTAACARRGLEKPVLDGEPAPRNESALTPPGV